MTAKNIVFIDSRVTGYKAFVAGLGRDTEWYLLDPTQDGVIQMQRVLNGYADLSAIHIVSHGSTGALYLGSTVLNDSNLNSYHSQLQSIGSSLSINGDLLLYGCDVAKGDAGVNFIHSLADFTGADVAASNDLTASQGEAGNTTLEVHWGSVEANTLDLSHYTGILATITGTENDDTLNGGGEADVIFALGGNDLIDAGANADWVDAGAGHDTVDGSFGNDTLFGGSGIDHLTDEQGSNLLDGGDDSDYLSAQSLTGSQTLIGGLGNDFLAAAGKELNLYGGDGSDALRVEGRIVSNGTTTFVQQGHATLSGGEGSDELKAVEFSVAVLNGDEGDDVLWAAANKDATLNGGAGNDKLSGEYGWNAQFIGDSLSSGQSYTMNGGTGNDTLTLEGYASSIYGKLYLAFNGEDGNDRLTVSERRDGKSDSAIAQAILTGGIGDDTLSGSSVLDLQMTGGTGRDSFAQTAGQYNTLQKVSVQLAIQGPTAANGWGYLYETVNAEITRITDFEAGAAGDILDVKDLLQNAAIGYEGANPFGSGHLKLVQSGADTLLQFDVDGSAGTANSFVTIAVLQNVNAANITAANFDPGYSPDGSAVPS
jgi:Ca2+-binding RTX toxin-like protein